MSRPTYKGVPLLIDPFFPNLTADLAALEAKMKEKYGDRYVKLPGGFALVIDTTLPPDVVLEASDENGNVLGRIVEGEVNP